MKFGFRLAFAACVAVLSAACPGPTTRVDGGTGGGTPTVSCVEQADCEPSRFFACDTSISQCVPTCRTKEDCSASVRGDYALDQCSGALGCQCDIAGEVPVCVSALCSADSDCGSQVCRNGKCVAPPAASEVAKCQVVPDLVVLKVGASKSFTFTANTASNAAVIPPSGGTWAASAGGPLTTTASAGSKATFTAATPTASGPVDAVTFTIGSATCKAKAVVLPATGFGIVVIDELSGRPIENADVAISYSSGLLEPQGAGVTVKTNAQGFASYTANPANGYSVSVFHPDYSYLTIANYKSTGSADHDFLSVYLRHNQTDNFGGYKGTFTGVSTGESSIVHAGAAGASIGGALTDLSLGQILGASVNTEVMLGTLSRVVPLPAGVYLGLSNKNFKSAVWAQGLAGVCVDSAGNPDEAKIKAGTCGTRAAWSLSGDVPIAALPISELTTPGAISLSNISNLLDRLLPVIKYLNSGVVRDVQFDLKAAPFNAATGVYDYSDINHFTSLDLDFLPTASGTAVPLSFAYVTKVPELPKFNNQFADGVIVLGGANVPGRGVVPLGAGVAINTAAPVDGQTDPQNQLSPGLVQVRMAPTHHGIEGSDYGLIIAALSAASVTDKSAGLGASALFTRVPNNKLSFDPTGASPINYSNQSFPIFPERATYNFTGAAVGALGPRTFGFKGAALDLSKVNVVRVTFSDIAEHRWVVLVDPAKISAGFRLPTPPGVHADRTFSNGMSSGERSTLQTHFMRLKANPAEANSADVSFNSYVEFNSTNADRTTEMLTAFSFIDFSRPKVEFSTPDMNPASVVKGSKVTVVVTGFKLGTTPAEDGRVKLSFSKNGAPVAGCTDKFESSETKPGNGTVEFTLDQSCVGTSLVMTATLVDVAAPPANIAPLVSHATVVTIQ